MVYLGENIPKLGFGLMRLPMAGEEIDVEQGKKMVDMFMSAGFTYFDTAYGYLEGRSEAFAKIALVDRYPRESFQLATKLPAWAGPKTAEEARLMFYTSLERTGAGYFDFYLLHNIDRTRREAFDKFDIWSYVLELKEKGLVRNVGFSFHDTPELLDELLCLHPQMDFVQLQINYTDWENNVVQSRRCYEIARAHGKPIVIMEPVKGGSLANLPPAAAELFYQQNPHASLSSWAMRFAASLDGIITVLSGMSDIGQMEDNIKTMSPLIPFSEEEKQTMDKVREYLVSQPHIPCTACRYCVKGCPQQIKIPGIFASRNRQLIFGDAAPAQYEYNWETANGGKASQCIACGQCERVCPQHINIIEELKTVAALYE